MKHRTRKMVQRWLALVLCLCMIVPSSVTFASGAGKSAEDTSTYTGGICEHHPEHTEACGYMKATKGSPCQHEHTADCYEWITKCVHKHTDACYTENGAADNTVSPSNPPERNLSCDHECSIESGCITKKNICQHQHDDTCGYAEAVKGHPCTFSCEICSVAANQLCETIEIQEFSALPDKVQMQSVPVGTERKELNLPSTLDFTDSTRKAGTVSGITWQSEPEFDGTLAGEYIFTPVIPGGVFSCKWDRIAQDHLTGDKTGSRTGEYHLALWR